MRLLAALLVTMSLASCAKMARNPQADLTAVTEQKLSKEYLTKLVGVAPSVSVATGPGKPQIGTIIDALVTDQGTHYRFKKLTLGEIEVDLLISEVEYAGETRGQRHPGINIHVYNQAYGYELYRDVFEKLNRLSSVTGVGASGFAAQATFNPNNSNALKDLETFLNATKQYFAKF